MLILGRDQLKDPSLGYARTFVRQVEDCLGLALERGVKIVSNAGGLNPAGLAARLGEVAAGLGLSPAIAYVDGDDVRSPRLRGCADRQRVPRRVRHRRGAGGRGGRRRDRPGHRRVPGGRAGRLVARLGADGVRRAGRRRRRRARDRVRLPGDGRQLLRVRRHRALAAAGLPGRGGGGRRFVGDHQARRHRRLGHGRHGHGPAALRGAGHPVPRARRDDRPDLDPPRGGGLRPRPASPACAGRPRPSDSRSASTSWAATATRSSSC